MTAQAEQEKGGLSSRTRTLCILIPVYNERLWIRTVVEKTLQAPLPAGLQRHLVIVDDGSSDGTRQVLRQLVQEHPGAITYIEHARNMGKGAAIRTAIQAAAGDFAIIQDADLEYSPQDYPVMLAPLLEDQADVVYGSRFCARAKRRVLYFWHSLINHALTLASNLVTDLNLTDMETCYKAFRLEILKSIPIRCDRFGIEPELTVKVAKRGLKIYEVPISYHGRTYLEGKKITAWDGIKALGTIFYYWLVDDLYDDQYGHSILHRLSGAHRFNRWMADTIRPFVRDRVLEIGGGIGNLTKQLLPRDEYTVTDIDPLHLKYLENRYEHSPHMEVRKVDLTNPADFDPLSKQFDTIVCLNVLEHIEDDLTGLRNMYTALELGGRALVLVPRGKWLFGTLDVVLGHFRRYSHDELLDRARSVGFEIETVFDFNRAGVPGWFLNAILLKRKHFGRLQLKIYDSLIWLFRRADRWLPWRGLSWIAVLRRPHQQVGSQPSSPTAAHAMPPTRRAAA